MTTMLLDETYGFSSGVLVRVFNTLIDQLRQDEPPIRPRWMAEDWLNVVNTAQAPELAEDKLAEDKLADDIPSLSDFPLFNFMTSGLPQVSRTDEPPLNTKHYNGGGMKI